MDFINKAAIQEQQPLILACPFPYVPFGFSDIDRSLFWGSLHSTKHKLARILAFLLVCFCCHFQRCIINRGRSVTCFEFVGIWYFMCWHLVFWTMVQYTDRPTKSLFMSRNIWTGVEFSFEGVGLPETAYVCDSKVLFSFKADNLTSLSKTHNWQLTFTILYILIIMFFAIFIPSFYGYNQG